MGQEKIYGSIMRVFKKFVGACRKERRVIARKNGKAVCLFYWWIDFMTPFSGRKKKKKVKNFGVRLHYYTIQQEIPIRITFSNNHLTKPQVKSPGLMV